MAKFFEDGTGHPRMSSILRACSEVADGMAYLHARGIVHGDLTGSNVLLQSNEVGCYPSLEKSYSLAVHSCWRLMLPLLLTLRASAQEVASVLENHAHIGVDCSISEVGHLGVGWVEKMRR